jgi:hypothetical protein
VTFDDLEGDVAEVRWDKRKSGFVENRYSTTVYNISGWTPAASIKLTTQKPSP